MALPIVAPVFPLVAFGVGLLVGSRAVRAIRCRRAPASPATQPAEPAAERAPQLMIKGSHPIYGCDPLIIGHDPPPPLRIALASFASAMADAGHQLPAVAAVHVVPGAIEFALARMPGPAPPAPLTAPADRIWRLATPVTSAAGLASGRQFPGLAGIGATEAGFLLANLEQLGVTIIRGGPAGRFLTGVAAELGARRLGGDYDLLLVGYPDSAAATSSACFANVLDALTARAVRLRRRLGDVTAEAVRVARLQAPGDPELRLTVLLSRIAPSQTELALLADLVAAPGGAAAVLADGGVLTPTGGATILDLDLMEVSAGSLGPARQHVTFRPLTGTEGRAVTRLAVDGRPGRAQLARLRPDAHLARLRPDAHLARLRPDAAARTGASPVAHARPGQDARQSAGLRIGVLGPLTINARSGGLLPAQSQLLVALALHDRKGTANRTLRRLLGADSDHPRPSDSLRQLIVRTRRQLGRAADGAEWIEHLGGGQYALHPAARLDWHEFGELAARGLNASESAPLAQAMRLVRGEPLADCWYWWLDPGLVQAMRTRIVDVATAVADLALAGHDHAAAARTARAGLLADPAAERLWRLLMRAEHAAGNLAGVREAWAQCLTAIADIAADGQPEQATCSLRHELMGNGGN